MAIFKKREEVVSELNLGCNIHITGSMIMTDYDFFLYRVLMLRRRLVVGDGVCAMCVCTCASGW